MALKAETLIGVSKNFWHCYFDGVARRTHKVVITTSTWIRCKFFLIHHLRNGESHDSHTQNETCYRWVVSWIVWMGVIWRPGLSDIWVNAICKLVICLLVRIFSSVPIHCKTWPQRTTLCLVVTLGLLKHFQWNGRNVSLLQFCQSKALYVILHHEQLLFYIFYNG